MLFINGAAMRQAVTLSQVMDRVEDAYRLFVSGDFDMPERPVFQNGEDTILYMPCFAKEVISTKFLTLFPGNPAKGLPYISGLMLLNGRADGQTLAVMDAGTLTALRTGAVGGVGMRCFAPAGAHRAGLIGCGTQGFHQLLYACDARDIQEIWLLDSQPGKDYDGFINRLRQELGERAPAFHVAEDSRQLAANSDIVITATQAAAPVLPDDPELLRGRCFVAIGSYKPGMRELPDAIWQLVPEVVTELPFALEESGDLSQPLAAGLLTEERVKYIGDLLTQGRPEPPAPGATTYFKSVGMGLLDLCVAKYIYEQALALGLGQKVEM